MNDKQVLVQVKNLVKHYPIYGGVLLRQTGKVHAVDDVSFDIFKGETFGLVGESGCGKSTVGKLILQLEKQTSGDVLFDGINLQSLKSEDLRKFRKRMQMIFQDPYTSLNPRLKVREIVAESMIAHEMYKWKDIDPVVIDLLKTVKLNSEFANRYPHEFSGGQRQRIGIARAIALNPDFIVCDEPISALDVSIQAQVINLLEELQQEKGLTYLFIAHDLAMVRHISSRVAVMYLGRLAELANCDELFENPLHPYTKALLSAVPIPDFDRSANMSRIVLEGDVPNPISPPSGCRFRTRCPLAQSICEAEIPLWREFSTDHWVACHLV